MREATHYEFAASERWTAFYESKVGGRYQYTKDGTEKKRIWWVSDHGNIKITYNWKEGVKIPTVSATGGRRHDNKLAKGYLAISVNNAPEKYIHRLVATFYIPKIEGKDYVNHLDGNKHNNHYSNLEWCTNAENVLHYHKYLKK